MTLPDCSGMERQIWMYLDRELPAEALSAVSRHLDECETCHELYLSRARESNHYRLAFEESTFGEGFSAKFSERLAREESGPRGAIGAMAAELLDGKLLYPRRRRWIVAAAVFVAAGVVLFVGGMLHRDFQQPHLGSFQSETGVVRVRLVEEGEAGAPFEASQEGYIYPGDSFEVARGVKLMLQILGSEAARGSELVVSGPAVFWVDSGASVEDFRSRLQYGMLVAEVGKDPLRRNFSVETPDAVATVLGTRFVLQVEPGVATRLEVERGKVAFRSCLDLPANRVNVEAGAGRWVVQAGVRGVTPEAKGAVSPVTPAPPVAPLPPSVPSTQTAPSVSPRIQGDLDQPVLGEPGSSPEHSEADS